MANCLEDAKMIMGTGDGFDCLAVKTEKSELKNYSSITSVVNTLVIDDFNDEMPVPSGAILIKDSYLREMDFQEASNGEDSKAETDDQVEHMFGKLRYIKTLSYNDIEASLVSYEKAVHITAFNVENKNRTLIGNKFFEVPEDPNSDMGKWTESEVIKGAFGNIDTYEDICRFVTQFVIDQEMLKSLEKGRVSEDTTVTITENAWELKDTDGKK